MKTIVFATNNSHKLHELRRILGGDYAVEGLADIGFDEEIEETADTFEGNALLKATAVASKLGISCIADDSGLEVDALGGAPGIYSARYAGEGRDSRANNAKLLLQLDGITDRRARFRTAIALVHPDGSHRVFHGAVEGTVGYEPKGDNGFGYDPLFIPDGWTKTFAEASEDEKNAVSHRMRAVAQLVTHLCSLK